MDNTIRLIAYSATVSKEMRSMEAWGNNVNISSAWESIRENIIDISVGFFGKWVDIEPGGICR